MKNILRQPLSESNILKRCHNFRRRQKFFETSKTQGQKWRTVKNGSRSKMASAQESSDACIRLRTRKRNRGTRPPERDCWNAIRKSVPTFLRALAASKDEHLASWRRMDKNFFKSSFMHAGTSLRGAEWSQLYILFRLSHFRIRDSNRNIRSARASPCHRNRVPIFRISPAFLYTCSYVRVCLCVCVMSCVSFCFANAYRSRGCSAASGIRLHSARDRTGRRLFCFGTQRRECRCADCVFVGRE